MSAATAREVKRDALRSQVGSAAGKAFVLIVLIIAVVALLIPIVWMISTSLKTNAKVFDLPIQWIPEAPKWENYPDAFRAVDFTRYFINSALVTACVTVVNVLLSTFAGYGLAKYRFRGRQFVLVLILATLMLPLEVIMIPLYFTVQTFGWLNSYQGIIFPLCANAIGVLVMRQYFLSLPDDLIASARIDGAGHVRTFFQIALPLSWPAVLTVAVLMFQATWDEFVWPFLIVTSTDKATVPLAVQAFQSAEASNFPQLMAVSTIAALPLTVLFFIFQRQFVRGVATTGLR